MVGLEGTLTISGSNPSLTWKGSLSTKQDSPIGSIFGTVTALRGAVWQGFFLPGKQKILFGSMGTHGVAFLNCWHEIAGLCDFVLTGSRVTHWGGSLELQLASQKLLQVTWRDETSHWNASALSGCLLGSKPDQPSNLNYFLKIHNPIYNIICI